MHIRCCAGIAQCTLKLRVPITQSAQLSRSISGPSSGFGVPIEGRQATLTASPLAPHKGAIALPYLQNPKQKNLPEIERLFFSLLLRQRFSALPARYPTAIISRKPL